MMGKALTRCVLAALLVLSSSGCEDASKVSPGRYDLALFELADGDIEKMLGTRALQVRKAGFDLAQGEYPVIEFQPVDGTKAVEALGERIQSLSGIGADDVNIDEHGDLAYVNTGSQAYWVNKASGAYSYTETASHIATEPLIKDHKDAVNAALRHVRHYGLLDLADNESLDVVSVSNVMNALVEDGDKKPFMTFNSDYFVVFGRRLAGIPVIGSYLQVSLGKDAKLRGVRQCWRPVSATTEKRVFVDQAMQDNTTAKYLISAGILESEKDTANVDTVRRMCGYIEGTVSNRQKLSGVGCVVSYKRESGEMIATAAVPLADYDFPLLGEAPVIDAKGLEKQRQALASKDTDEADEGTVNEEQ